MVKLTKRLKLYSYILYPKVTECGRQRSKVKTRLLQRCALRKFHVTDGQNTRDQITSDRRSKRAWSNCVMCIPFILGGSPNECWLHTSDPCVITTWTLGLRAPLVACNDLPCLMTLLISNLCASTVYGFYVQAWIHLSIKLIVFANSFLSDSDEITSCAYT